MFLSLLNVQLKLYIGASLVAQTVKNLPENRGDPGSIPGLGRCPGGGNGNQLQYFCLGNSMEKGAWKLQSTGSQRVRHNLVAERTHT